MTPAPADSIESLRALAQKMDDALNAGLGKLFCRLAGERVQMLEALGHSGPSEKFKGLLAQCAAEDRRWLDLAKNKRDGLREELDRILVRRNGLSQLAKVYDRPPRRGQYYSGKS